MAEREIICSACDGEGEIEHPHMPTHEIWSEAPSYAIVECEDCRGTGKVWTDEEPRPTPLQRLAALRNDLSAAITIGLRKNRADLVSLGQRYSLACNSLAALYKPDNGDDRWLASEIGIIELGARDAIRSLNEASSLEEVRANYRTFLASSERRNSQRRKAA